MKHTCKLCKSCRCHFVCNNNNKTLFIHSKTPVNYNSINNSLNLFTLFPALSLESTNFAVKGEGEKQIRQYLTVMCCWLLISSMPQLRMKSSIFLTCLEIKIITCTRTKVKKNIQCTCSVRLSQNNIKTKEQTLKSVQGKISLSTCIKPYHWKIQNTTYTIIVIRNHIHL